MRAAPWLCRVPESHLVCTIVSYWALKVVETTWSLISLFQAKTSCKSFANRNQVQLASPLLAQAQFHNKYHWINNNSDNNVQFTRGISLTVTWQAAVSHSNSVQNGLTWLPAMWRYGTQYLETVSITSDVMTWLPRAYTLNPWISDLMGMEEGWVR